MTQAIEIALINSQLFNNKITNAKAMELIALVREKYEKILSDKK